MARHMAASKRAMPSAMHLALFFKVKPDAITDPGPRPSTVGETDKETKKLLAQFTVWKFDYDEFTRIMKEDEDFKADMLSICPTEATDALADPNGGTTHLTAAKVLQTFDEKYGKITADTLESCRRNLPQSCSGSVDAVQTAINKFTHYFDLSRAATDQEPPDHEKISKLEAILPSTFDLQIALQHSKYPDIKDRTFKQFAAAMLLAAATLDARDHTVNSVATTQAPNAPIPVSQEYVANAITTAIAAAANKPGFKANKTKNTYYCWSHGINKTHDPSKGTACLTPHANHDPTATFRNKKGGKTTVWERGQALGP
jgi:hypothetical protein